MCVGSRPHPFGNKRHTIFCGLKYILWRAQVAEDKDQPQNIGQKKYNELSKMVSLMIRMCRPFFGSGKSVVLETVVWVTKGITQLKDKGFYARFLIKKQRFCPKGVHGDLIDTHFEDKEIGHVERIEAITEYNNFFKLFV